MDLMSAAFDAAYDSFEGEPSQAVQLQLATRIMAAVNAGVLDLERLTAIALGAPFPVITPPRPFTADDEPTIPSSAVTGQEQPKTG